MELILKRLQLDSDVTIGELYVDGKFECFTCEDTYRPPPEPKVYGKTAIPCGRYEVYVTMSSRFKVLLPLLIAVPGFEGIRIHPGNTAEDTDGCILPGQLRLPKGVGASKLAFQRLFPKIRDAKARMSQVWITIVNTPE